jgi:uncharacterized metal-binding protein
VANGNTHDRVGLMVGGGLALSAIFLPFPGLPLMGVGCAVGTLWLSPDLDLPKSNPRRRWGILKSIWNPYHKLVPHRSWISHSIGFSTAFRVLYLCLPLLLIPGIVPWIAANSAIVLAFYLGLEIATWVHLILDGKLI